LDALREAEKTSADPQANLTAIDAALKAVAIFQANAVTASLEEARGQVEQVVSNLLIERRTALAEAAREAGWIYTRFGDRDRLGEFDLHYSKSKVKIVFGSEELTTTSLIDGRKIFDLVRQERQKMESVMLSRGEFFNILRLALAMAKADGKGSNGKVKVRELFPYLALTRQLAHDTFRKKPLAKNFTEYSIVLLAFELYKFGQGEEGWFIGDHRLVNQPPNMATHHEALILPGPQAAQILWLGIE
jgi:hypothetical protein